MACSTWKSLRGLFGIVRCWQLLQPSSTFLVAPLFPTSYAPCKGKAYLLASSAPSMMTWPPPRPSRRYSSAYHEEGLSDTKLVLSSALVLALREQPGVESAAGNRLRPPTIAWRSPLGVGQVTERRAYDLLNLALKQGREASWGFGLRRISLQAKSRAWYTLCMSMQGLNLTWPQCGLELQDTCIEVRLEACCMASGGRTLMAGGNKSSSQMSAAHMQGNAHLQQRFSVLHPRLLTFRLRTASVKHGIAWALVRRQ